ncbi:3-oxoacid CoA-transferase [Paenibacillus sp. yr247]|uniref:3-oxoacid CoA-transferase subunit B n=1 Tax=Paenibacillus sp. yr247 TaxID=1761880 RepID=UPI000882E8DF|nr:3-oxoacid CoA-transferase subunit B [Paenibacillus sp. yr247]SDP16819.1 3-oxoacid CoA-transferase [Paenibacillus sp. yr247]
MLDLKQQIAKRAAEELSDGDVVNLGIGIPTLVADFVPGGIDVFIHTENGLLGVGPTPGEDEIDPDLVNAGKLPVTETIGSSFFSSADSFAMIRGHHVDVAILGTLQVDATGRISNWSVPGKAILGVGGAMDLLVGAKKVIVTMTHSASDGTPKIVDRCTLPITAERKVDMIITELAVFTVGPEGLTLVELMPGVGIEEVKKHTEANFLISLLEDETK